ncbi:MAG: rRNA maturation RNase YbeY [Marinilabiliales bacterium]
MSILFHTQNTKLPLIKKNALKKWINNVIGSHNKKCGDINIIFTTDDDLLEINKQYLKRNTYTDIICFDYCENETIAGDLFISLPRVEENSIKYNVSFLNELHRVIIHGILHLLGYKDKTEAEKEKMRKTEDFYLNSYHEISKK